MQRLRKWIAFCALAVPFCFGARSVLADDVPVQPVDKSLKGDQVCTLCHDETWKKPILALYQTRMGQKGDSRTPGCQTCHGPSKGHLQNPGNAPDVVYGAQSRNVASSEKRNSVCLSCHQKDANRSHWMGSTHQSRDVACVSCHEVHTAHDDVRDKRTQPNVCFTCHKEQRGQINKPSHHPIPEGKMACSDCHNPHGSVGPKLVKRDSINDTCYTCHMEKRGPFVHEHEPVSDDCTNCHNPHGTTAENLLKARPPFLCHQCHTPHGGNIGQLAGQGQSSTLLSGTSIGQSGINITQGRGCVNCHTQIHGSNNPALTNPTPQFFYR